MGASKDGFEVERLSYEGVEVRVVRRGRTAFVVARDVSRAVDLDLPSRLLAGVEPRDGPLVRIPGVPRAARVASAMGLAEVLRSMDGERVEAFVEWAKEALFPLILCGRTMEDVSSALASGPASFLEWKGSELSYEGGDEGAFLMEDHASRRLWGTAAQIAAVFGTSVRNVEKHLAAIYASGVLPMERTSKDLYEVRSIVDGRQVRRAVLLYDFEAISAVGDRVSSKKAAAFRKWRAGLVEAVLLELAEAGRAKDARIEAIEGLVADFQLRKELLRLSGDPFPKPERPGLTLDFFPGAGLTELDREKIRAHVVPLKEHRRRCAAALRIVEAAELAEGAPRVPVVEGVPRSVVGLVAARLVRTEAGSDPFALLSVGGAEMPVLAMSTTAGSTSPTPSS